jgi:WD40 repeat protein
LARNVVKGIVFTPDGRYVISAGEDGFVRVWRFSPQTGAATADLVQRWSLGSVQQIQTIAPQLTKKEHAHNVIAIDFSPDGKSLVTGSRDDTAKLWDVAERRVRATLEGHRASVYSVEFSPDGKILATGSFDKTARLWNAADGSLIATLKGHTGGIRRLAFSPDGKVLVTASQDKTVKLWDVESHRLLKTLITRDLPIIYLAVSPDGTMLATCTGIVTPRTKGALTLWDIETGMEIRTIQQDVFGSPAFSPDGALLACRDQQRNVTLFDVATGKALRILKDTHNGSWVKFSPDGRQVASAYTDGTVKLNDVATGHLRTELLGHKKRVWSFDFAPDGNTLVSGGSDGMVIFWDIRKKTNRVAKQDGVKKSKS